MNLFLRKRKAMCTKFIRTLILEFSEFQYQKCILHIMTETRTHNETPFSYLRYIEFDFNSLIKTNQQN